jgi:hypothetical protein
MYYAIAEHGTFTWQRGRVSYPQYDTYVPPMTFDNVHAAISEAIHWAEEEQRRDSRLLIGYHPLGAYLVRYRAGEVIERTDYTVCHAHDITND